MPDPGTDGPNLTAHPHLTSYASDLAGVKHKLSATLAPTVDDDSGDGYAVNSFWIDSTNEKFYVCFDASVGAAVWKEVGPDSSLGDYTAAETMTAPCLVNVKSDGEIQYANATDALQPADGFILDDVTATNSQTVYGPGSKITGLSGLTPGAVLHLDTTDGALTETAPSTTGNVRQYVGKALSATTAVFNPQSALELV